MLGLDGTPLGAADVAEPYELAWLTTTTANGMYTITAVARDGAGHETMASAAVTVMNLE